MGDDVLQGRKLRFLHGNTADIVVLLRFFQCRAPGRAESLQLRRNGVPARAGLVDKRVDYAPANVVDIRAHLGKIGIVDAAIRRKRFDLILNSN